MPEWARNLLQRLIRLNPKGNYLILLFLGQKPRCIIKELGDDEVLE